LDGVLFGGPFIIVIIPGLVAVDVLAADTEPLVVDKDGDGCCCCDMYEVGVVGVADDDSIPSFVGCGGAMDGMGGMENNAFAAAAVLEDVATLLAKEDEAAGTCTNRCRLRACSARTWPRTCNISLSLTVFCCVTV
jgi:hypothetical protein